MSTHLVSARNLSIGLGIYSDIRWSTHLSGRPFGDGVSTRFSSLEGILLMMVLVPVWCKLGLIRGDTFGDTLVPSMM